MSGEGNAVSLNVVALSLIAVAVIAGVLVPIAWDGSPGWLRDVGLYGLFAGLVAVVLITARNARH